jgi:hypothetical protein
MNRRSFDRLLSWTGLLTAVFLLLAGTLIIWGAGFAQRNVSDRLEPQRIFFAPAADLSDEEKAIPGVLEYAGQQVLTGDQARVFSDVIGLHLQAINDGKTYSETSTESRANPDDAELAGKVQTLFRGETLRGLLLNAYGWWFVGRLAFWGGVAALGAAGLMLVLTVLGFRHLRRTSETETIGGIPSGTRSVPKGAIAP